MRVLLLVILSLIVAAAQIGAQELKPRHPLDALTPGEIELAVELLQDDGLVDEKTAYPIMELSEPLKEDVLAWTPGTPLRRAAHVVLRRGGRTYEAVVDLSLRKIRKHEEIPGVPAAIMRHEWNLAQQLTKRVPRWPAAMRQRGLSNEETIICKSLPTGYRERGDQSMRRLIKVPCFAQINKLHTLHARSIRGKTATVDTDAGSTMDIIDKDRHVPPLPAPEDYHAIEPGPTMKPELVASPNGTSIKVTGSYQVDWQNWSFHLRADRRAGLIASLVKFNDRGRQRLIAYQFSIAEMFVPYMDRKETLAFRGYLDAGELGLGYLISPLSAGEDCPQQAVYVHLLMPSDRGGMFHVPRSLCIFERTTRDTAWRHYDASSQRATARQEIELVVRYIPTIGNYDYVIDYVFQNRGIIKFRIGTTGFDSTRSVDAADTAASTSEKASQFGAFIAPYTVAPHLDHFVSFRLDLDIDGTNNVFMRDRVEPRGLAPERQRGDLWILQGETVDTEGPVNINPGSHGQVWRIANPGLKTGLKHDPSYQIEPAHQVPSLLPRDDPLRLRAGFAAHSLWLTAYNRDERWSAGSVPNLSAPEQGLPSFVADAQNIANTDIVAWYTLGFRHINRPGNSLNLPTRWHEFQLRPVNFFDRDPWAGLTTEPLESNAH